MRCIETLTALILAGKESEINYNMRCIETAVYEEDDGELTEINYNMRCIETEKSKKYLDKFNR